MSKIDLAAEKCCVTYEGARLLQTVRLNEIARQIPRIRLETAHLLDTARFLETRQLENVPHIIGQ